MLTRLGQVKILVTANEIRLYHVGELGLEGCKDHRGRRPKKANPSRRIAHCSWRSVAGIICTVM
jgi:hypothetical protein